MARDTTEIRRRSAAIFGNEKVVEVVLAIEAMPKPHSATAQDVSRVTGIGHGMVRDVLLRLVAGELLVAVPKVGGSRSPQYYLPRAAEPWARLVSIAQWVQSEDDHASLVPN